MRGVFYRERHRQVCYTTMHAEIETGRCAIQLCMLGYKQEDVLHNYACWDRNRKMCYRTIHTGIETGRCATQLCMLG